MACAQVAILSVGEAAVMVPSRGGAMQRLIGKMLVLAACLAAQPAWSAPRAVIELFTSQGCSSCPPADRLVGEFAQDPAILAMSLPIDYWDYLGWRDTLASSANTARQRAYARARGDREVYTPQVVVNGMVHAVGSDREAIAAAIGATDADPLTLSLAVRLSSTEDAFEIAVPAGPPAQEGAGVWLLGIAKAVPVTIGTGENGGRTVIYHNVVRRRVQLGEWNGQERSFRFTTAGSFEEGVDAVAVLVQAGTPDRPRKVLGAACSEWPANAASLPQKGN
jgi:hypothetical protein